MNIGYRGHQLIFMKISPVLFILCLVLLPGAAFAKKASEYPVTYAGGSLPLNHNKLRAALGADEVTFIQHSQRIVIPLKSITEISCGEEVRHRLGGSVLGIVPLVHLGETEDYYIGVGWLDAAKTAKAQVLLRLSHSEYREFLAALEQLTGIKAVDTNRVPTVVRYNG